jgi:hypothetical protein
MSFDLENSRRENAARDPIPLAGYVASMAIFTVGLGAAVFWVARRRPALPTLRDVGLLGAATHKLSRILSKDFVTAPIRAPFTRRAGSEGAGEGHDEARGGPLRRAVGHLLTCPYCLGPWIATGLGTSMAKWPLPAGFVARVLSAVAVSDFLHLAYARLNESRKVVLGQRKQLEGAPAELPAGGV